MWASCRAEAAGYDHRGGGADALRSNARGIFSPGSVAISQIAGAVPREGCDPADGRFGNQGRSLDAGSGLEWEVRRSWQRRLGSADLATQDATGAVPRLFNHSHRYSNPRTSLDPPART